MADPKLCVARTAERQNGRRAEGQNNRKAERQNGRKYLSYKLKHLNAIGE